MSDAENTVVVRDTCGDWKTMPCCGRAPKHDGQSIVIVRDDQFQCYAARLTPAGYVMISTPISLYVL